MEERAAGGIAEHLMRRVDRCGLLGVWRMASLAACTGNVFRQQDVMILETEVTATFVDLCHSSARHRFLILALSAGSRGVPSNLASFVL